MNDAVMERDICCQNFKGMIAYIRNHYGEAGVRELLSGLTDNPRYRIRNKFDPARVETVQEAHLTDPAYWVSNDFSLALFENVYRIVPTPEPLIEVGMGAVRELLSRRMLFAARLMGPAATARQVARINARFNRTKDVTLTRLADGALQFELRYRPGFRVTRNVCHWNLGIYTEIGRLTGAANIRARETRCVVDGHDRCVFEMTWDPAPWHRRLLRETSNRVLSWLVRDLIEEYETTAQERDQLIERLLRSEQRYRTLFEDSLDAMSLTTAGKIVDVNPAWLRLHGYARREEVLGMDVINVVHPEDRGLLLARRKAWPRLENRLFHLRDLRVDGSSFDAEAYAFPILLEGKPSILATVRDVTERRRAEEAQRQLEARLQRSEKMEALGTLAGGVAHDLNNILSGLIGYPDLLLMQLSADQALLREPLLAIRESGLKAAAIVQDLLTLARRGVAVSEVVNLNALIADYLRSPECEALLARHPHVQVETALNPDLLNLAGSPVHLVKTVMNLVTNAAEAMPAGGTITLRTENRHLDRPLAGDEEIPAGDYVLLTVADTGVGIAAEDREKIFEPFYTKKAMGRSGTGLGMAVVWGAVKDHRGHIRLESDRGRGTRFSLYLPATDRALPAAGATGELDRLKGKGERILVVDDMAEQREIARRMLLYLGYVPDLAASGEEALARLAEHPCDLMLLDMIMAPGMDGLDTYRKVLALRPGQRALIASGYSETDRVREAQRLGAGRYLKKPYTLEALALALREALDR